MKKIDDEAKVERKRRSPILNFMLSTVASQGYTIEDLIQDDLILKPFPEQTKDSKQ